MNINVYGHIVSFITVAVNLFDNHVFLAYKSPEKATSMSKV